MYIINKKEDYLYRPNVGCVILHNKNIFVARRIASEANVWQMPQGGIMENEQLEHALFRELMEEIGTNNVKILQESKYQRYYKIPQSLIGQAWEGKYIGQKQKWFLVEFAGRDDEININTPEPEFCEWKWMSVADVLKHAVHFKKDIYHDVFAEFNIL